MDDLISRQAAIDKIEEYFAGLPIQGRHDILEIIKNLPSAQPEHEHTMEEFMFGQDMGNPEDGSL